MLKRTLIAAILLAAQVHAAEPVDSLVDATVAQLERGYVYPEVAARAVTLLRQHQNSGAYRGLDGERLARALTDDLRRATADKHLHVMHSAEELPVMREEAPSDEQRKQFEQGMKDTNFGIGRVERLGGNIGYLELRGFLPAEYTGAPIAAAMTLLQHTDALIIDLRNNGGGDPGTVALLASYLLDGRVQLNDMLWREGDRLQQFWTYPTLAGPRYGGQRDVYVLTSPLTFSAAEDFAYALSNLKRVTVVGEATGGGAHPGDMVRLNAHYQMFLPGGRSRSPVTGTDWEGTGVQPGVRVPAAEALKVAHAKALDKLLATQPLYVRGSMNDWGLGSPMQQVAPGRYAAVVAVPAGKHEFKIATRDFNRVDFGPQPTTGSVTSPLLEGRANFQLEAARAGKWRFELDLTDPARPSLKHTAI